MTNKPYSYKKHDFLEAYAQFKAIEGIDEAIKWFKFNTELIEEALEIAGESSDELFAEVA